MLDFEKCFGDFLEGKEYDQLESEAYERLKDSLCATLRTAYRAGWLAAGTSLLENKANVETDAG